MKTRYLTFDCYGTLVDWKKGISAALRDAGTTKLAPGEILEAYLAIEKEQERTYQKYRDVLASTALGLSWKLGFEIGPAKAKKFAASVPTWPAFPDSREFLRRMREDGYRRYVLSNVDEDLLRETIRKNRLDVDGYVTAQEVGSYKPGKRHWMRFMEKTGASRGEILHVAQSVYHDIIPAQSLGISCAWVNRYREAFPAGVSPMFVSDSLAHLGGLLEEAA